MEHGVEADLLPTEGEVHVDPTIPEDPDGQPNLLDQPEYTEYETFYDSESEEVKAKGVHGTRLKGAKRQYFQTVDLKAQA